MGEFFLFIITTVFIYMVTKNELITTLYIIFFLWLMSRD